MKKLWITVQPAFLFQHKLDSSGRGIPREDNRLMCLPLKFLAAVVLALLSASPVYAVPVLGSFQGIVRTSTDRVGNLFTSNLSGQSIEGNFSYDTNLAPSGLVAFGGTVAGYLDPDYSLSWIDASLNVGGLDLQVQSSGLPDETVSDRIIVENDRGTTSGERDGMQLISNRVYESYDYSRVYRNALVLAFGDEENQLFSDTELPTELIWGGAGFGSGSWVLYSSVESEILYDASLVFDLTSVTLTAQSPAAPVPEPSTLLLLGFGLAGLGVYARQQKKHNNS